MEFWLAEGIIEKAKNELSSGIFRGIITNPEVIAETGRPWRVLLGELATLSEHVFFQLRAGTTDEMVKLGREAISIAPGRIHAKVPATRFGLAAIKELSREDSMVMATCVPTQTWLIYCIAAGAGYVSPYSGMIQKSGIDTKFHQIQQMQDLIQNSQSSIRLCVGIYDPSEVAAYARLGVAAAFIWPKDLDSFLAQPLVDSAVNAFNPAWQVIDENDSRREI